MDAAYPCSFRVRFLDEEYAPATLKYIQQEHTVTLGGDVFRIATVTVGSESYQDLLGKAEPVQAFRLVFSLTCLASKGTEFRHLFPEPRRIFLSLARLWNQNAKGCEIKQPHDYAAWLKPNIGVTGYALQTSLVTTGKKEAIGFTGWANYRIKEGGQWNKTTTALAKFAEYSNIGANRTGGFGVTRFAAKTPDFRQP